MLLFTRNFSKYTIYFFRNGSNIHENTFAQRVIFVRKKSTKKLKILNYQPIKKQKLGKKVTDRG